MSVFIPVSVGELIDKITILSIKQVRISEADKLVNIKNEYIKLDEILSKLLDTVNVSDKEQIDQLTIKLMIVNDLLWDIENKKRYHETVKDFGDVFVGLARDVYKYNDERARIKRTINDLFKSEIVEEKCHVIKKAFVLSHLGMGDSIHCNGLVRTLATRYDIVVVVCLKCNKKNVEEMYRDCPKIKILETDSYEQISVRYGFDPEKFKRITDGYDVYMSGYHTGANFVNDYPYSFYDDCKIPRENLWEKFHLTYPDNAMKMYDKLKDKTYVFVHNICSDGIFFEQTEAERLLSINKNECLVINPVVNHYNESEPYFEIANSFIGLPIFDYVHVLINASKIFVCDSSFFCLAYHLPIKTNDCFFKKRLFDYSWFDNKKFKIQYSDRLTY
jgi:hypothetical protein